MEVIGSRYGLDRSIEKLNYQTMRIMGESKFVRMSENKQGKPVMFDFEGGPCLTVGGRINYGNINWKITDIDASAVGYKDLATCLVTVTPMY